MMEIEIVRKLLGEIALDHSSAKPDPAMQKLALALMHMAEGIEELRIHAALPTVSRRS
jgi:hypothetical protein